MFQLSGNGFGHGVLGLAIPAFFFLLGNVSQVAAAAADDLVASQRSFADVLTADLYQNENECTSCLGISMAFSLIYPSSAGISRQQMEHVFGYDTRNSSDPLVWDQTTSSLVETYQGKCFSSDTCDTGHDPLVSIANRVWVRDDAVLNTTYAAAVGDSLARLDFTQQEAGGIVNDWVKENTNGLVDSIVQDGPLPIDWVLMAINAIYFKASWLGPFFERLTNEDVFYTSALRDTSTGQPARFMHQVDHFDYSDTALGGYQVIRLRFSGISPLTEGLSMIFVLPNSNQSPPMQVTSGDLYEKLPALERTKVALALPRFKFESMYSGALKKTLEESAGLVAPFQTGLCVQQGDSCGSNVDHVVQKTVIDVNEKGVEAAAVTLVAVGVSAPPPEQPVLFLADHPFQFFIHDAKTDVFLFEGRVGNPGIPEQGVPETAALQMSHNDTDFWRTNLGEDPLVVPLQMTMTTTTESSMSSGACGRYHRPFSATFATLSLLVSTVIYCFS